MLKRQFTEIVLVYDLCGDASILHSELAVTFQTRRSLLYNGFLRHFLSWFACCTSIAYGFFHDRPGTWHMVRAGSHRWGYGRYLELVHRQLTSHLHVRPNETLNVQIHSDKYEFENLIHVVRRLSCRTGRLFEYRTDQWLENPAVSGYKFKFEES